MSKKNHIVNGIDTTQGPPWLCHAGLPSDGSVMGAKELEVFGDFMSPTKREVEMKAGVREVVQRHVRQYVSGDATVKLVGAAACGIESYANDTEMVIELPTTKDEVDVLRVVEHLCTDFECDLDEEAARLTMKIPDEQITVQLTCDTYNSKKRREASIIRKHLAANKGTAKVVRIIRSIINQMKLVNPIGLSYDAVTVLVIAFLEHMWRGEDLLWTLRSFFYFYSNFEFGKYSVSITSEGPKFLPKTHQNQMVVLHPMDGGNLCEKTIVGPITATFKYVLLSIAKWDTSASLSRGKSLLFNLLAHKDLWPRYMKLKGIPIEPTVPKPAAVASTKPAPEEDPSLAEASGRCEA